jgi:hypothetical protein
MNAEAWPFALPLPAEGRKAAFERIIEPFYAFT